MARLEDPFGLVCPEPVGFRARSPVGRGLPVLGGGVFVVGRRRRWCQRGQEPRTVLRLVWFLNISYSPVSQSGLSKRA